MAHTGARGHQVLDGKLDLDDLGTVERALVRTVRAAPGEHRDWAAVRRWAFGIADELVAVAPGPTDSHPR